MLVLDPVVAGVKLTNILIDRGNGLNVLFCEYDEEDGAPRHQYVDPNEHSIVQDHPRERGYARGIGGTASYLWAP